jgi:hypothetical protein
MKHDDVIAQHDSAMLVTRATKYCVREEKRIAASRLNLRADLRKLDAAPMRPGLLPLLTARPRLRSFRACAIPSG